MSFAPTTSCLNLPFSSAFPALDAKERVCLNQGENKCMLKMRNVLIFTEVEHNLCLCPAAVSQSHEKLS